MTVFQLLATLVALSHASPDCSKLLTGGLQGYLGGLLSEGLIGTRELESIARSLEAGEREFRVSASSGKGEVPMIVHREASEEYLRTQEFDRTGLLAWVHEKLGMVTETLRIIEESSVETRHSFRQPIFQIIHAAQFKMGDGKDMYPVDLQQDIAVMSTQMTQSQWVELFGLNPSEFIEGVDAIDYPVNGIAVRMMPDHPVEKISWWSAVVAANKMSEKLGLPPVYDLNGVTFVPGTSAANGTLRSSRGDYRVNTMDGDIYKAVGIRLPTEAELEYLMREGGKEVGEKVTPEYFENLKRRSWFHEHTKDWIFQKVPRGPRAVATLKPVLIDGQPFYDLQGNVDVWAHDWLGTDFYFNQGVNPIGTHAENRAIRGGDWEGLDYKLHPSYRAVTTANNRRSATGVRFVRTAKDMLK